MILAALAAARFLHFAAAMLLFGAWAYALYGLRGVALRAVSDRLKPKLYRRITAAAVLALISGAVWLALIVANIGGSFAAVVDGEMWSLVLGSTDFGRVWVARIIICALLVVALLVYRRRPTPAHESGCVLLGSGVLLSLASIGHTQDGEGVGRAVHMAADALHLVGASLWLGGLVALALLLHPRAELALSAAHSALGRFSRLGYVAVGALVISGVVNSYFLVGEPRRLLTTVYGSLLLAKLALFGVMVALAAANRFIVVPQIAADVERGAEPAEALQRIRHHVIAEQGAGALILGLVAVLGTIEPASAAG